MSTLIKEKALICSVGGSPEPIIYTIEAQGPTQVAFFCSEDSYSIGKEVLDHFVDRKFNVDIIRLTDPESLTVCYKEIREGMNALIKKWNLPLEQINLDYTGGTKTMSAAIVLAAAENLSHFSYIGGSDRDKGGIGVVINGKERRYIQSNPWKELAIREIEKAGILWNSQQYSSCASLLDDISKKIPQENRIPFKTLKTVAEGLAARMAFHLHPLGKDRMHSGAKNLLKCHSSTRPLQEFCTKALERFKSFNLCANKKEDASQGDYKRTLDELLDNAILTSKMGRYEDACARLYRYTELQAQVWLWKKTNGAFYLGKFVKGRSDLPPELQSMEKVKNATDLSQICFALEDDFYALSILGHAPSQRLKEDFHSQSKWRNATSLRNHSILAHGLDNITKKKFITYCEAIEDYFDVSLEEASLPVPIWNDDWLLPA